MTWNWDKANLTECFEENQVGENWDRNRGERWRPAMHFLRRVSLNVSEKARGQSRWPSKCHNTCACGRRPPLRLSFQPAVNHERWAGREHSGAGLLAAESTEVCALMCWGCQLHKVVWHFPLSWGGGRVMVGGKGKESSYQPKRTAAWARALPSLTTHVSSKCALGVAFSNPNKKPGDKRILWLALFSVPWNVCRHGDPSPDFFFF